MAQYLFANGAMPTTAAQVVVTTGTAIKTLLQLKGVTALRYKCLAWGVSFDGSAAATPIKVELLETGTVFGTVTAAVAADLPGYDAQGLATTSTTYFSVGTSATGYTCTAEGAITATRIFDVQLVAPTNQYAREFSLGREPYLDAVSALRIRVTAGTAVNAYAWVLLEA